MDNMKTKKKSLKTTPPNTGRQRPMSPPGGYGGKRKRYPNGGKLK